MCSQNVVLVNYLHTMMQKAGVSVNPKEARVSTSSRPTLSASIPHGTETSKSGMTSNVVCYARITESSE